MNVGNVSAKAIALDAAFTKAEASKQKVGTDSGKRVYVTYNKKTEAWGTSEKKSEGVSSRFIAAKINQYMSSTSITRGNTDIKEARKTLMGVCKQITDRDNTSFKGKVFRGLAKFGWDPTQRVLIFSIATHNVKEYDKKNPQPHSAQV